MTPSTAHRSRARTRSSIPRRVSGPAARGGAVALPAPRRGTTGIFERLSRLPDHAVVDRLLRGRSWIWLIGVALGGIVAMQVSLLKLNTGISRAVEASATLERQNAGLEADIAKLSSGERIQDGARKTGMVQPPAGSVNYLTVRPGSDARRAARAMKPPSPEAKQLLTALGTPAAAVAPGAQTGAPDAHATAPGPQAAAPTETAPAAQGTAPAPAGTTPGTTGTAPAQQGTAPNTTGTAPGATGATPQGTAPAPNRTAPDTTGTAPDQQGATPAPGTQEPTGGAQTGAAGGVAAGGAGQG